MGIYVESEVTQDMFSCNLVLLKQTWMKQSGVCDILSLSRFTVPSSPPSSPPPPPRPPSLPSSPYPPLISAVGWSSSQTLTQSIVLTRAISGDEQRYLL